MPPPISTGEILADGLGEDDWEGRARLTGRLGNSVQLVGDGLGRALPAVWAEPLTSASGKAVA
ncbi:hypothetical protein [Streptomyces sp. UG1]|uniref:hypothetical protein n=1 Tax=Streptomyces sp. UG1 TaxID=3417652 RepID=UPI003CF7984E